MPINGAASGRRDLLLISSADLFVRTAYQMGKTPLLPIFASSLGATELLLGVIVSVSTFSGMVLKPIFGMLSDRWGRIIWIWFGTALFTLFPLGYWLVSTPQELIFLRLLHGCATAIYGPVTLAYVSEISLSKNRGEYLGWFGCSRSMSYILGPGIAGLLLMYWQPAVIFSFISFISVLAFFPLAYLSRSPLSKSTSLPLGRQIKQAFQALLSLPALWFLGCYEATLNAAIYALKTFLPLYAISQGLELALAGLLLSIQEAANMLSKPLAGKLGDQFGYNNSIVSGICLSGLALMMLPQISDTLMLLGLGACLGIGKAFLQISIHALMGTQLNDRHLGVAFGFAGTLKNIGKIAGSILGGSLLMVFDFATTMSVFVMLLLVASLMLFRVSGDLSRKYQEAAK